MTSARIQGEPPLRVFALLRTTPEGLSEHEARRRLDELGPNTLAAHTRVHWGQNLLRQLANFFTLLLLFASALSFVADQIQGEQGMAVLGWALLSVALLNALFAFFQESRAERAMAELKKLLPAHVVVRRGGKEVTIDAEQVVPGDVLRLEEGERVPADARLVESDDLLVDNAALTGESRAIGLTPTPSAAERLVDSRDVALAGATILRGSGVGVVFATGRRTELGKIASLSDEIRRPPSPLERETARMIRILTAIAVVMGLVFFAYGVASGRSIWYSLVFLLGIIVANVPEGLLPTFTLALALGGLRLARRNVLVKNLNAVESLGSVQVICTDKTGTLTQNQLAVTRVVDATGAELAEALRTALLRRALVASDLHVRDEGALSGDPLDVAIATAYARHREDALVVLGETRRRYAFDAHLRRSAGVICEAGDPEFCTKGAWEVIRPMVTAVVEPSGETTASDEASIRAADLAVRRLAAHGYRVIAVAARHFAGDSSRERADLERELVLVGFVCLEDPLRPEVPAAITRCEAAGLRVVMVTGDHPDTARAIGARAGLKIGESQIITGDVLDRMRESDLVAALDRGVSVFARTTPEQKMKIVGALQRLGQVVAMTGDGVNDAPALKAADVGIAMGRRGTDVAREAAQVILLDDNFASIVAGVEEGRAIFANIRKFTSYVLVSNGPEIIPYLLFIALPVPLALGIIPILCIDLGTDILPAMGLGKEPPDADVMKRPPRRRDERLLDRSLVLHSYGFLGLLEAAYSMLLFFLVLYDGGWRWGQELDATDPLLRGASGITLASIMLMQIGNLVGRRSATRSGLDRGLLDNRLIVLGFAVEAGLSFAVLYVPAVADVLGTGPAPAWSYALAWLGVPYIFLADYLRKRIVLSHKMPPPPAPATGAFTS